MFLEILLRFPAAIIRIHIYICSLLSLTYVMSEIYLNVCLNVTYPLSIYLTVIYKVHLYYCLAIILKNRKL